MKLAIHNHINLVLVIYHSWIYEMLYEKYNFTPDKNYQQIIDKLNLPYHLDGVIIDEFNNIISDKFDLTPYYETDYFYE